MNSVLLTGGTGFIGRHTIEPLLDRNYIVHAIHSSSTPFSNHPNLYWHALDLHNRVDLEKLLTSIKPTHLLHLAWYVKPSEYRVSFQNLIWHSTSIHLITSFINNGGKRAVIAGSAAEYDVKYGHCKEFLTPCLPNSLYGTVKHSLRLLCEKITEAHGSSFAWARLFFLFGKYEYPERFVSSIILSMLQNKKFTLHNAYQIRDFLYVTDVGDAIVALLDSNVEGPVNIASGSPIGLHDLLYIISKKLNAQHLLDVNNANLEGDDKLLSADISRLKSEVNWKPRYTLDAALDETIQWWKERH